MRGKPIVEQSVDTDRSIMSLLEAMKRLERKLEKETKEKHQIAIVNLKLLEDMAALKAENAHLRTLILPMGRGA